MSFATSASLTPNFPARRAWMLSSGRKLEQDESTIITRPVGARVLGKSPWPHREQIRVLLGREGKTRVFVTDGLSEPFVDDDEYEHAKPLLVDAHGVQLPVDVGYGLELWIESGDCVPPSSPHEAWALTLLLWLSGLVTQGDVSLVNLHQGGGFMTVDFATTRFDKMHAKYKRALPDGNEDELYTTLLIRGTESYKSTQSGVDVVMAQVTILPSAMAEQLQGLEAKEERSVWLREVTTREDLWVADVTAA